MRILLLGSGAREHAFARALAADPAVTTLIAAPGNPGIAEVAELAAVDIVDPVAVTELARRHGVDLVVVGPEAPLVAGVADELRGAGFAVFGPSAAAAALEGSKSFAKEIMAVAGVPTAMAHVCTTLDEVAAALDAFGAPHVVKDDGLAAGKGVVVTDDREEALAHAAACLDKTDGRVVVEDFLDGPECSVFCVCDGGRVLALEPSQDFKRVGDGDAGPNTGGMGAYSPLDWAPADLADLVRDRIAGPVIDEMARRGTPFVGILYVGLAMTSRGPRVVEFNARLGDPDGQVVLARLLNPLGDLLLKAATGRLDDVEALAWSPRYAVDVVVAAHGYPGTVRSGDPISGLADPRASGSTSGSDAWVLHAGTAVDETGTLVSAGGRVLNVVALGDDLEQARRTAYDVVSLIGLDGSHHRTDIAAAAARGEIVLTDSTQRTPPEGTPR